MALLISVLWLAPAAAALTLESNTDLATAGYYQLSWADGDPHGRFQLQQAPSADFRAPTVIYEGADLATVLSGQPDGTYFYRIRPLGDGAGPWSETVSVRVQHHPLGRAWTFFTMGAIVFVATLVLIVSGSLKERRERHG